MEITSTIIYLALLINIRNIICYRIINAQHDLIMSQENHINKFKMTKDFCQIAYINMLFDLTKWTRKQFFG